MTFVTIAISIFVLLLSSVFSPANSAIFNEISLAPIANVNYQNQNSTMGYLNPPRGEVVLGGIPFFIPDNNNAFDTAVENNFSQRINVNIPNPLIVHLLINSGNTWLFTNDRELGSITLDFADGDLFETKLIIGQNIREWSPHPETSVNTVTDPGSQEVYKETFGYQNIIDMLSFNVPANYQNKILTGVRVTDSYNNVPGYDNPVILWSGLTIESISETCSCADVVNNSVTVSLADENRTITATFTPQCGGTGGNPPTLQQAAFYCGFTAFNWQSTVTSLPAPSPIFAVGSITPLITPPAFNDPPPDGYKCNNGCTPNAVKLPIYWNLFPFPPTHDLYPYTLAYHQLPTNDPATSTTLRFRDKPADSCLPDGRGTGCGGKTAPAGSKLAFTTHLVGIVGTLPEASVQDTGIGFNWTDTFNGTSGGISVLNNIQPVDPGSGTGGITITRMQNVMTGDTTPLVITILATPATLWPPNGKMVSVTVSGKVTDDAGGTGVDPSTAVYQVTDEYGQVQPSGSVTLKSDGSYSFRVQLQASRNGNDLDGRHYIITVGAQDNAGNPGSTATSVIVPHD